jgi:D-ribose pyranase
VLKTGILNPAINSLLSRVRHTNTLVIADRGFPFWPQVETIDIALTDDIPTVLDVVRAVLPNFQVGRAFMAEEFTSSNTEAIRSEFEKTLAPLAISFEPHAAFKKRVTGAIGLIRSADTTQYANIILESA